MLERNKGPFLTELLSEILKVMSIVGFFIWGLYQIEMLALEYGQVLTGYTGLIACIVAYVVSVGLKIYGLRDRQ
jgi:hypothetical protein